MAAAALLGVAMLAGVAVLAGCWPKSGGTSTTGAEASGTASSLTSATTGVAETTASATTALDTATPVDTKPKPVTKPVPTIPSVTHQPTWITKHWVASGGVRTLTCDYVQFLTGKAAIKAAKAHGDTVENDYYIVNDNKLKREIPVAAGVTIVLHPGDGPQFKRTFTLSQFEDLMDSETATYGGKTYSWSNEMTFYINVKNGKITRIENQWVP
jgi:hypothetical protein